MSTQKKIGRKLGKIWENFGKKFGNFWEKIRKFLGKNSEIFAIILGKFWEESRNILGNNLGEETVKTNFFFFFYCQILQRFKNVFCFLSFFAKFINKKKHLKLSFIIFSNHIFDIALILLQSFLQFLFFIKIVIFHSVFFLLIFFLYFFSFYPNFF